MMGWDSSWGWTMMFGGIFVWGGLLVLLVWLLQSAFRSNTQDRSDRSGHEPRSTTTHQTPLEVLQSRYAKGEISRDEYLRMRQDIES